MLAFDVRHAIVMPRAEQPFLLACDIVDLAPRQTVLPVGVPGAFPRAIHHAAADVEQAIRVELLDFHPATPSSNRCISLTVPSDQVETMVLGFRGGTAEQKQARGQKEGQGSVSSVAGDGEFDQIRKGGPGRGVGKRIEHGDGPVPVFGHFGFGIRDARPGLDVLEEPRGNPGRSALRLMSRTMLRLDLQTAAGGCG